MEEALGADGHGFLEQHDALIGLMAEELQGGEAAGLRHVEMLLATRGYDKALCSGHCGALPCGGMRIDIGPMNIKVDDARRVSCGCCGASSVEKRTTLDLTERRRCSIARTPTM